MPPRAMWTGQLRFSLVTFGVRLYAATESSGRVSMNQLHKGCHQRLKQQMACPVHGPVERDDIVKGYEYEKDTYVIIEKEELDNLKLETTKTIDLVQFVDADEINPLFIDAPYFLGPDGPVAEEAFRVIREALRKSNRVGVGKLVLHNREHVVALRPETNGMLLTTLRYASEVRSPAEFFKDISNGQVDKEHMEMALTIIKKMSSKFNPAAFTDRYQDAFITLVKEKVEGAPPIEVKEDETPASFNFMEALKRSVEQAKPGEAEPGAEPAARRAPGQKAPRKPAAKSAPAEQGAQAPKKRKLA